MSATPSYHDECNPENYDSSLAAKVAALREQFASLLTGDGANSASAVEPRVFPSPSRHFRSRCRFQVVAEETNDAFHHDEQAAGPKTTSSSRRLSYRLWDGGGPTVRVSDFPMALESINAVMPVVLRLAEGNDELSEGLEAVHFLAARQGGGMLVTLVYSRPIGGVKTYIPVVSERKRKTPA